MSDKPLVSIIITVFNYEKFIGECIESCLAQTYEPIEIIVIDDCSTDDSVKIIQKYFYDKKINNPILCLQNYGYSFCKNVGIREAKGEFLVFIDADDMLTADSVKNRMAEFEKNPKLDFVHGIALRFYGFEEGLPVFKGYNKKTYCHAQGRMYRRSLHEKYGLYYEGLRSMADKEWVYRLGVHPDSPLPKLVKEKKLKKVCAWYRKHDLQMHKLRRKKPKVNEGIKKQFKKRIKQLKKEGITPDNTDFL